MNSTKDILREIAVNVVNSKHHSDFLKTFATAYLGADQENEEIMRPAWLVLIDKYGLDKEKREAAIPKGGLGAMSERYEVKRDGLG